MLYKKINRNRINAKKFLLTEAIKKAEDFERVRQPIQTNEEASEPVNKKRRTVNFLIRINRERVV